MPARPRSPGLLDIGVPEMSGNELAAKLRMQKETAKSLFIAVSGFGQEQDKHNSMDSGFDHHLVKPLDMAKLAALLASL